MCFYYKSTERKSSRYCRTPQTRYSDTCTAHLYVHFKSQLKPQRRKESNVSAAFSGDQVLEWNGKLLQGATFKEVYNIILESKPEPQVELVVSRPLGWERTLSGMIHPNGKPTPAEIVLKQKFLHMSVPELQKLEKLLMINDISAIYLMKLLHVTWRYKREAVQEVVSARSPFSLPLVESRLHSRMNLSTNCFGRA